MFGSTLALGEAWERIQKPYFSAPGREGGGFSVWLPRSPSGIVLSLAHPQVHTPFPLMGCFLCVAPHCRGTLQHPVILQ